MTQQNEQVQKESYNYLKRLLVAIFMEGHAYINYTH